MNMKEIFAVMSLKKKKKKKKSHIGLNFFFRPSFLYCFKVAHYWEGHFHIHFCLFC